jgi:hypothetical protein
MKSKNKRMQFSVVIPTPDERHRIVMERIMERSTLIPDIENLEKNDKKLFDFLYHYEDHGWAIYSSMYDAYLVDELLQEANNTLKKKFPNFDMTKQETYGNFPFDNIGFLEMYHLKNLYKMRFDPKMVKLFQILYNTENIRVLIDRMSFKRSSYQVINDTVTERRDFIHNGFIHHDMNLITGYTTNPIQCVVSLSDTDSEQGGWQGIDYFHWNAKKWSETCDQAYTRKLKGHAPKIPIMVPEIEKWSSFIVHPEMKKGDILVWKSETAHGNGANHNKLGLPRIAAYINYVSAEHENKCTFVNV